MSSPRRLVRVTTRLCVPLMVLTFAPAAGAAANHPPLFKMFWFPNPKARLEPGAEYPEGPCGVAVRPDGGIYVSDYYHDKLESWDSSGIYVSTPITGFDPADGPCGLAADSGDGLFVNDLHRDVTRYTALGSPQVIDTAEPTGVAYDPATDRVYVDDRGSVSVYEDSGAPVEVGGAPLRIGAGAIGDGYGVAVSDHPGQEGFVYVPDAASDTIKVFDPATSLSDPVSEIDGAGDPEGGFRTLRDAAVAIDQSTGHLFVIYNSEGPFYEHPHAAVAEFNATGAYRGTLPGAALRFGEPSGIAVDNSGGPTQGRVFVSSGNSEVREPAVLIEEMPDGKQVIEPGKPEEGAVFAFGPTAPGFELQVAVSGEGTVTSEPAGIACPGACAGEYDEGATVKLSAAAAPGWEFAGWSSGGCGGAGDCTVTIDAARALSAEFVAAPSSADSAGAPSAEDPPSRTSSTDSDATGAAVSAPAAGAATAPRLRGAGVSSAPGRAERARAGRRRHPRSHQLRHPRRREHRHGKNPRRKR